MDVAHNYDVIVIGWGKAGKTLAAKAARSGLRVAMIERDARMYGGTCINVGCLPTKSLVHASYLFNRAHKEEDFSVQQQAFREAQEARRQLVEKLNTKNYHLLADLDLVDCYLGEASFIDVHQVQVKQTDGSRVLSAPKIIINTGARSLNLPVFEQLTSSRIHSSTSILQLDELPNRLLIVGTGFIGMEFASYFANFGTQVEMLQFNDDWLPREDKDIASVVRENLEAQGVTLTFNAEVKSVHELSDRLKLEVMVNGTLEQREVDQVLVAIGRKPNTEALQLDRAGVELGARSEVLVDEYLRSSSDGIWAVGDVRGGAQFTFVSLDDARIVAPQIIPTPDSTLKAHSEDATSQFQIVNRSDKNRPVYATCTFVDPPFARIGMNEKEAQAAGLNYKVRELPTLAIPKAHVVQETRGISKVLVGDEGHILGASLIHYEAHEMINLFVLAMNHNISAQELSQLIYTHPSFSESLNDLLA